MPYPTAIVGGASALAALWYLMGPGRSITTALADVQGTLLGALPLTSAQDAIRQQIEAGFVGAGLGHLGVAAVANAYAESRLDPAAIGDGGHSVGLFQLNDCSGCGGSGMSVELRQDPAANIARAIALARAVEWPTGLTHAELASQFAAELERCALCAPGLPQYLHRAALVRQIYGAGVADTVPR